MAYIKHKNGFEIGEWTNTTKYHDSLAGAFEVGTLVQVIGVGDRGYEIQDEFGNQMIEIGWVI